MQHNAEHSAQSAASSGSGRTLSAGRGGTGPGRPGRRQRAPHHRPDPGDRPQQEPEQPERQESADEEHGQHGQGPADRRIEHAERAEEQGEHDRDADRLACGRCDRRRGQRTGVPGPGPAVPPAQDRVAEGVGVPAGRDVQRVGPGDHRTGRFVDGGQQALVTGRPGPGRLALDGGQVGHRHPGDPGVGGPLGAVPPPLRAGVLIVGVPARGQPRRRQNIGSGRHPGTPSRSRDGCFEITDGAAGFPELSTIRPGTMGSCPKPPVTRRPNPWPW